MLATFAVTNVDDSGSGSLRQAVIDANILEGEDLIIFDLPPTSEITLVSGPLLITESVTIDGTLVGMGPEPGDPVRVKADSNRIWNVAVSTAIPPGEGVDNKVIIQDMEMSGIMGTGGGIEVSSMSTLTLNRVTIAEGAADFGGAIQNFGTTTVTHSTISGNTAMFNGGGIANYGSLTLYNSTVSGNSAFQGGGVAAQSGNTMIVSTTVTNNTTLAPGGGVFVDTPAQLVLHNAIVGGNLPVAGLDLFTLSGANVANYSLIQSSNISLMGTGNISGSPNLGPLADNGGPTLTHLPHPGSPVIDAGDTMSTRATDQRMFAGVVGVIDMGSVEVGSLPLPTGDFNNDGLLNIADIDALVTEIAAGTMDLSYDVNGDMVIDASDLTSWLALAGNENLGPGRSYLPADANLDGVVDGLDFIAWNAHKLSTGGTWSRADFNADGVTDGADFSIWNSNKFQSSISRTSARTVPRLYLPGTSTAKRLDAAKPVAADGISNSPTQAVTRPLATLTSKPEPVAAIVRSSATARRAPWQDRVDVAIRMLYDAR